VGFAQVNIFYLTSVITDRSIIMTDEAAMNDSAAGLVPGKGMSFALFG
jgi:hypothetical protein